MLRHLSSPLFLAVMTLMGVGLVQVYSSSYVFATESHGDALYFFKRQLMFCGFGFFLFVLVSFLPMKWVEKWGWTLWIGATFLVLLTLIPSLAVRAGGAARWLQTPFGFRIEPSELLKGVFAIFMASLLCRKDNFLAKIPWYYIAGFFVLPLLVVLKQPDFGSFLIMLGVAFCLLFAFGLKTRVIVGLCILALPMIYFLISTKDYRMARIAAFLDPWADPEHKGFQLIQSMLSFSAGGLTGAGLGQGQGKLFFLPEAHTDFTLAVLGEETGFFGFSVVMILYGYLIFKAFQIAASYDRNRFRQALALGIGATFAMNVFINVGVVLGMLPTKGLTLPFLSYGGSSVVVLCLMFGLLVNLEKDLS